MTSNSSMINMIISSMLAEMTDNTNSEDDTESNTSNTSDTSDGFISNNPYPNTQEFITNTILNGFEQILISQRNYFLNTLEDYILEETLRQSFEETVETENNNYFRENNNNLDLESCIYNTLIYDDKGDKEDKEDKGDKGYILDVKETSCSICLSDFSDEDEVCVLRCKHIFHKDCIQKWVNINNICPNCKQTIN